MELSDEVFKNAYQKWFSYAFSNFGDTFSIQQIEDILGETNIIFFK